ncbi:MAG: NAD-dependent epimerase/dehydratase family protein [Acidobacteria bacterium]|nr:NAD-dependent epimerase/dehydratase family protein [Acidobacteriota bacterium]
MSGIIITGSTSALGADLVARLIPARPGSRIYLLTRQPDRLPEAFRGPRFSILHGDLRDPMLGLSTWQTAALRRSLTEIVHVAAHTNAETPLAEARAVNVEGTRNLLRLAVDCERLTKFLHLSTVYVAGRLGGQIPEAVLRHSHKFSSECQQSRYEAETVVAEFAACVPVAIARLSNVIGDSAGKVHRQNCIHRLVRMFPRSHLQQAPFDPKGLADFIDSDWAADAIVWLFLNRFRAGEVWHISDGPSAGFTMDEVIAETHRIFVHHPRGQRWMPIDLPKLVPLRDYEEHAERTISTGSRLSSELLRSLEPFLPHLGIAQTFENHRTRALLAPSGILPGPARDLYAGMVRWCLDTDWGLVG